MLRLLDLLCDAAIVLAVVAFLALGFVAAGCVPPSITYCSPKGWLAGACPTLFDPPAPPDGGP